MAHPVSVRFHDPRVADQLKAEAIARRASTSSLAEELIDEGLRTRRHPLASFRDGPAGRRAHLIGGPDVWEVVEGLVGGDVPPAERISRAVEVFGLPRQLVEAALAYYAEFTEEIDDQVDANRRAAEEAEAQWRRQQDLLAG
ncbi:MAG: CopG family transcriptional regulator [Actinomycetota bacterium]|nr:CopG family transcriptional regulator [Actinomycetota bacterium]